MSRVAPGEIKRGLVLHLDPDELVAHGGSTNVDEALRVRGQHFFLCLTSNGQDSRWLPLYTSGGKDRVELPRAARDGHPKWTDGSCFYHPEQVWSAPIHAVIAAAIAGQDKSTPAQRSTVKLDAVPRIPMHRKNDQA